MHTNTKILSLDQLVPIIQSLKSQGKRIVSTNGCFDIVHPGHVESLEWAKAQGDVLVVGINTDESVRLNKGVKRPVVAEAHRARVLAGLAAVDFVFLFGDKTPHAWLERIQPQVHVKSADYTLEQIPERAVVEKYGGEVRLAPKVGNNSTTSIINKILELGSEQI